MTALQLVISPELSPHIAKALGVHVRWCDVNGIPVPDGLVEVQKWAQVVARGLSSPLPLLEGDDAHVEPLILTLPQAAEVLGCSVSKVKTLIAAGQLPVIDFGGVRRVRRSDIEAFVERLAGGTSFRDSIESKATEPPASRRRLPRSVPNGDPDRQTEARSAPLDKIRSSA